MKKDEIFVRSIDNFSFADKVAQFMQKRAEHAALRGNSNLQIRRFRVPASNRCGRSNTERPLLRDRGSRYTSNELRNLSLGCFSIYRKKI